MAGSGEANGGSGGLMDGGAAVSISDGKGYETETGDETRYVFHKYISIPR